MACRYTISGDASCRCDECTVPNQKEIAELQAELAEWRTGKRRVYWYIKHSDGSSWPLGGYVDRDCRKLVNAQLMSLGGPRKAMRVTVGPRGNVRPWRKK